MKLPHIFHKWMYARAFEEVEVRCGPYDPRSDAARTSTFHEFICCVCGEKRSSHRRYL